VINKPQGHSTTKFAILRLQKSPETALSEITHNYISALPLNGLLHPLILQRTTKVAKIKTDWQNNALIPVLYVTKSLQLICATKSAINGTSEAEPPNITTPQQQHVVTKQ
jgi:hypothetical protein